MILMLKKEIYEDWVSEKYFIEIRSIFYPIVKKYYEWKGYEVEIYDWKVRRISNKDIRVI